MESTADRAVKRAKATLLREEEEKEEEAENVLLEKFVSFRGSVAHITALEDQLRLVKEECALSEDQLRLSKEECEKVKANCRGAVSTLRTSVDLYLTAYDDRSFEVLCRNFAEDLQMMVSIEERKGQADFVRIENYRHQGLVAEHKSIVERELFALFCCR